MWDIRICFCGGSACAIRNQHLKVRKGACQHGSNGDDIPDHHKLVCAGGRLQCPWKEYNEEIDADGESDDAGRHGNRGNCSDLARFGFSIISFVRRQT